MLKMLHNVIKTRYVRQGYLPNYPYHLISDEEMFSAFLNDSACFFSTNYPCLDATMDEAYAVLKESIAYHIAQNLSSDGDNPVPSWVYSYMLGECISLHSPESDRQDLLTLLNLELKYNQITAEVCQSCLKYSTDWIRKLPSDKKLHRPPTMFGEAHVIKSLRLIYR